MENTFNNVFVDIEQQEQEKQITEAKQDLKQVDNAISKPIQEAQEQKPKEESLSVKALYLDQTNIGGLCKINNDISNYMTFNLSFKTNAELLIKLGEFNAKLKQFDYSISPEIVNKMILGLVKANFFDKENITVRYCNTINPIIINYREQEQTAFLIAPRVENE